MKTMTLEEFANRVSVIEGDQADGIRQQYIDRFVDTDSDWFQQRIAVLKPFTDGLLYTGYLWDCLVHWERISEDQVLESLRTLDVVSVFWDQHSAARIPVEDYWKFPKRSVLELSALDLGAGLEYLPEDIYIFDDRLNWSLIFTHEFDNGRVCVRAHAKSTA
jgi:hypothetical protein